MSDPQEKKTLPPAMTEALRAEFLRLIEGPQFIQNLTILEQFASRARELALTLILPEGVTTKRHRGTSIPFGVPVYTNPNLGEAFAEESGGIVANTPMSAPSPEQFGAKAIREIVNLAPAMAAALAKASQQSPVQQVLAISAARDRGLFELAKELETKLLGEDLDDDVEPIEPAKLPSTRPSGEVHPS